MNFENWYNDCQRGIFSLIFFNKTSLTNKWMSFSSSNSALTVNYEKNICLGFTWVILPPKSRGSNSNPSRVGKHFFANFIFIFKFFMKYTKKKYIFIYWYFSYKRKWFKFYSIQFFMEKLKMIKKRPEKFTSRPSR